MKLWIEKTSDQPGCTSTGDMFNIHSKSHLTGESKAAIIVWLLGGFCKVYKYTWIDRALQALTSLTDCMVQIGGFNMSLKSQQRLLSLSSNSNI